MIAPDVDFVFVAVIHNDVRGGNASRLDAVNDFPHEFGRGGAGRSAGGINLDADDVGRVDKPGPGRLSRSFAGNSFIPRSIMSRTTVAKPCATMDLKSRLPPPDRGKVPVFQATISPVSRHGLFQSEAARAG